MDHPLPVDLLQPVFGGISYQCCLLGGPQLKWITLNLPEHPTLSIGLCAVIPVLELTENAPEGIAAGPKSEDNFFDWEAVIVYEASFLSF